MRRSPTTAKKSSVSSNACRVPHPIRPRRVVGAALASISWPMLAVGLPPVSVVLTGVSPRSGPDMPVNLLAAGPGSAGVRARILDQAGQPITVPVRIAYYATKRAASEI